MKTPRIVTRVLSDLSFFSGLAIRVSFLHRHFFSLFPSYASIQMYTSSYLFISCTIRRPRRVGNNIQERKKLRKRENSTTFSHSLPVFGLSSLFLLSSCFACLYRREKNRQDAGWRDAKEEKKDGPGG